jgi:hypothetical protein
MHRRLLIATLTGALALALASTATAAPKGPQGAVNGKKCGVSVGFALTGTPQPANGEITTKNENQQFITFSITSGSGTVSKTFAETTCADSFSKYQTSQLLNLNNTKCIQYDPTGPKNSGVKGSQTTIVIGNLVGKGGIFAGTCRSFYTTTPTP